MFQNSRLDALLEYFLTHQTYIPSSRLTRHFEISERTLRSDIQFINEELQKYQAQILMKRKEGYYLQTEASVRTLLEQQLQQKQNPLDSAEKRIHFLMLKLLYTQDYLSLDALADAVFVSINTILNYLKQIRQTLAAHQLSLHNKANLGYLVTGTELDKRKCIMQLLTAVSQSYAFQFTHAQKILPVSIDFPCIKELVMGFNQEQDIHFSDYNLRNLILQIGLVISRVQLHQGIESNVISNYQFLAPLLNPLMEKMENAFQIQLDAGERNYIYSYYLSSNGELLEPELHPADVHPLVERLLHYIYESYHIDLRTDTILSQDLSQHLQSILNAKHYQLSQKNPLLDTIRQNYILAYEITETAASQAFEAEPFVLSEDELGYIALHIGASMERYFDANHFHRKKALIIYENGYAEGSFLASRLTALFHGVLEITKKLPSHELNEEACREIDFIISTIALKQIEAVPVIVIEIPLLRKDIENISKAITREHVHPVNQITQFFSPGLFLRMRTGSREQVIHAMCSLLEADGGVSADFENSVLEREARISTAMDGILALPHPMTICSSKSRVAVCILEQPVAWSSKSTAQIVLMLALADDQKKEMKILYETFVAITSNPQLEQLLLSATNISEFLQLLITHIPEEEY